VKRPEHLSDYKPLRPRVDRATGRHYFDSWTTPFGALACSPACEHCDGERSRLVRKDDLRGWVCPHCDSALDEMLAEPDEVAS